MKKVVTNNLGLPLPVVQAIVNDPYNAGDSDYTVTGLLKAPRAVQLQRTNEIILDAADAVFLLQGKLMHLLLEQAGEDLRKQGCLVLETRFFKTYEVDGKKFKVSAQIDVFDPATGILSDYKYSSVGAAKRGLKEDHRWQLNFQAMLLRERNYVVKEAEIVHFMRDWNVMRQYGDYPPSPTVKFSAKLLSTEEVDAWVVSRIRAHEAAKASLPTCTSNERLNSPTYAVMKTPAAARATRVLDSRDEAQTFITAKGFKDAVIVERPGLDVACLFYCPARAVCDYAASLRKAAEEAKPPPMVEDGMIEVT